MPKRFGHLWQPICDIENIKIAVTQVLRRKQQKGRWSTHEQDIQDNFDNTCKQIQRSLTERTYEFGILKHRNIRERKKIRSLDYLDTYHSIYLQCVLNICQPLFISKYIPTTYSSIKGRGLTQMSQHIWKLIQKHPDKHFILVDMTKCYENVSHDVMNDILAHTFKDIYVLEFFKRLLDLLPQGMAIGFSTNHYLVNLLFNNLDHRIENRKEVDIIRFMDDIAIFAPKDMLPTIYRILKEETDKIKQKIKPNTRFAPINYGMAFCGNVYFRDHMKLKPDIVHSIYQKDKQLRKQHVPDQEYKQHMASYWGWCKYSHATALFESVLKDKKDLFAKQLEEMKHFQDFAEPQDKHETYTGEYWIQENILNQEVEFLKFREVKIQGVDKIIVQARINDTEGYFFTQSIGIWDKLKRYKDELPFAGKIVERPNRYGKMFMTIE